MRSNKVKVNGNFTDWVVFKKVDSVTFWCSRKSEQFGFIDVAKFEMHNGKMIRVTPISRRRMWD